MIKCQISGRTRPLPLPNTTTSFQRANIIKLSPIGLLLHFPLLPLIPQLNSIRTDRVRVNNSSEISSAYIPSFLLSRPTGNLFPNKFTSPILSNDRYNISIALNALHPLLTVRVENRAVAAPHRLEIHRFLAGTVFQLKLQAQDQVQKELAPYNRQLADVAPR